MKYKMVSTDFDDTLLRDDNTISPYTRKVIEKYISAGGVFMINTGRMVSSIVKRAKELNLKGKAVGYQGAMIYDLEQEKIIYHNPLDYQTAYKVIKKFESLDLVVHVYIDDKLYYKELTEFSEGYEKISDVKGIALNEELSEYVLKNKLSVTKVLAHSEPDVVAKLLKETEKEFGGSVYCCRSKPYFLEVLKFDSNKGLACKFIADSLGIGMEDVLAFGDSNNDIPMLKMAGLSFAMENGLEEAKAAAKAVCESNNDDGVAKMIEKYCL